MSGRFHNQAVLITGASSGIGAEMARCFAQEGARLALTARRRDRLDALAAELQANGAQAIAIEADVTDRAALDAAVDETARTFGRLDVAVANAGFGVNGMFERLRTEDFRRQFETNVFGLVDTVYAALPYLIESRGRLGLVSSVLGQFGAPASSIYAASKHAVNGLAESLHYELAEHGISVTCIQPGVIATEFRLRDNEGRLAPDGEDPAPRWLAMPADKAARAMVRAMARRRYEAVITGHGKLLTSLRRHFPRTFRWIGRRLSEGKLEAIEKGKRSEASRQSPE